MQATASITAQNFLAPGEDLGYKVEYRHPYFFSGRDPKRTALAVSIFNARKISGVFTPGEGWGCALCTESTLPCMSDGPIYQNLQPQTMHIVLCYQLLDGVTASGALQAL